MVQNFKDIALALLAMFAAGLITLGVLQQFNILTNLKPEFMFRLVGVGIGVGAVFFGFRDRLQLTRSGFVVLLIYLAISLALIFGTKYYLPNSFLASALP